MKVTHNFHPSIRIRGMFFKVELSDPKNITPKKDTSGLLMVQTLSAWILPINEHQVWGKEDTRKVLKK